MVVAVPGERPIAARSERRVFLELALAYGLILLVEWTPRPWQKILWWIAAAAIVAITCLSFEGWRAMGLRTAHFFRSFWIAGVALVIALAAAFVAARFHSLRLSGGPLWILRNYWAYAIWSFVQQFLLQCFFLSRLLRLLPTPRSAALAAATILAVAHLPNPVLAPVTLIWGFAACLLFLRYRNLYPLALAHAILGISIATTVPGHVDHNMRVGLGYLTYHHRTHPHSLPGLPPPIARP